MIEPIAVAVKESVHETPPTNGESLDMYMVEKLVTLTEQSVQAQNSTVNEIKELRTDLTKQSVQNSTEHAELTEAIKRNNRSTIRQVADWVAGNPGTSVGIFMGTLLTAVIIVLISQTINADSLNSLRNSTSVTPTHIYHPHPKGE